MTPSETPFDRRRFLGALGGLAGGLAAPGRMFGSAPSPDTSGIATGEIPASGETIPAIGMGTYITFNVGPSKRLRDHRVQVLQTFFDLGGGMIDSSPMYGSSEDVIGHCLERTTRNERLFSATKVWTPSAAEGREQIKRSRDLWHVPSFDLLQIHNLVNWREHLRTLRRRKESGATRYIGATTSHGRRHAEMESLLRDEPLDFVQLSYSIANRAAEDRLIPLARERGVAVIANRPYERGRLMDRHQKEKLPPWRDEVGVANWADFFLKFIISHPGVTCAIPATSQVPHMRENMGALRGKLPDEDGRRRMAEYVARL